MKSTFFGGSGSPDEKESAGNNIAGFLQKEKRLFAELKANFNALCECFQHESAIIIADSQKKSDAKQNAEANLKIARWNNSPLQLLITTTAYSIKEGEASEFSYSAEYSRLKKMFFEADLDFSGETADTQEALKKFISTFRELESWLQRREELMNMGSMVPMLAEASSEVSAINNHDRELEKFKNNCDRLAETLQDNIKALFIVLGARSSSAAEATQRLDQAHARLHIDDISQEEHAELLKTVAAFHAEQQEDQHRKHTSKFYQLYCDYKDASLSLNPAELIKTDLYQRLHLLIQGDDNRAAADFTNEKPEVQKLAVALHNHIHAFENMQKDNFFYEAYPELRENAYQPPKHL